MTERRKQPYVRFFASDWLGGTRGMKAMEVGVYITLLALMYERCEPLPEDHKRLSRQCGCTPKAFSVALEMLVDDGKIQRTKSGLWNKRVEKEFVFRAENSQQSRKAANKRWGNTNKNKGRSMPAHSERNAGGMPYQKPEAREKTEATASVVESGFDQLWQAWQPYKTPKGSKKSALAEWNRHVRKAGLDPGMVSSQAVAYCAECQRTDTNTQHVERWIKKHRWEDERIEYTGTGKRNGELTDDERTEQRRDAIVEGMQDAGRLDPRGNPAVKH